MRKLFFFLILTIPLFFNKPVIAHPGRTAADGCHYCRTNCDSWGVPWNERHCHNGGGTVQGIQESSPVYNSPTNTPIPWPTWTPIPISTLTPTETPIPTLTNTPTPTPTNAPSPIPANTITPKPTKKISSKKISESKKQVIKKKTFWQWLFNI